MSYIGRGISNLSDRAVLDSITASATATYNLLLNTVAYVPSSAESLTVSLNGVIQKPVNSYTVSGSTIVFDSSLASTDSIDFILAERAITLTTIGSGTVTTSNIVDGNVTNAKLANSSITLNGSAVSLGGSATIGGGKVGQVVQGSLTSVFSTTSSTYGDIGLSAAITPVATSSKVLVQAMIPMQVAGGAEADAYVKVLRGSTTIHESGGQNFALYAATGAIDLRWVNNFISLDSPSTASAVTYKFQYRTGAAGSTARASFQNTPSYIILTEVLA